MRKELPNFASISEFVAGLNGDCGETATLAALHCVDAARWPLTPAGLASIDHDEISHGYTLAANGEQNVPEIDSYLTHLGVAHRTVGYAQFSLDQFHADLKALAGVAPILVEWANAQALPGDEAGVHYHFATCGGVDSGPAGDGVGGGYLWCDGDNRADPASGATTGALLYGWPQIQAAQPIGYTILTMPTAPQPPQGGGNTTMLEIAQTNGLFEEVSATAWRCTSNGAMLADGLLAFYRALPAQGNAFGLTALGLPLASEQSGGKPNTATQDFERGRAAYDPSRVLDNPVGSTGDCYLAHSVDALDAAVKAAQAAEAAAQQSAAQAQSALAEAQATNTQLQQQIQQLEQQLADSGAAEQQKAALVAALKPFLG